MKTCKNGHDYWPGRGCPVCTREAIRDWQKSHRGYMRKKVQEWRLRNPAKVEEQRRQAKWDREAMNATIYAWPNEQVRFRMAYIKEHGTTDGMLQAVAGHYREWLKTLLPLERALQEWLWPDLGASPIENRKESGRTRSGMRRPRPTLAAWRRFIEQWHAENPEGTTGT